MQPSAAAPVSIVRTASALSPRVWILLGLALACVAAAVVLPAGVGRIAVLLCGATFAVLVVLIRAIEWSGRTSLRAGLSQLALLVDHDAAPCFTTDANGAVGYQNAAAATRFGNRDGQALASALGDLFANPGAVLYRLQTRAARSGAAREDVVTRRGSIRLSVHNAGAVGFLWRLEEMTERNPATRGAEALSLPMLIASKSGTVLFANEALRRLLGGRPKTLDRVFPSLPLRTGEEVQISGVDGTVRAMVAELTGAGERREIYLLPTPDTAEPAADRDGVEDLPVALVRLTPDGVVRAANRVARDLLGIDEVGGRRLSDLVDGLGRPVLDWVSDVMADRAPGGPQVLQARRQDKEVFLQVTLRRTVDRGRPGLLAVLNDATELKTLEAQFVQSQKMQAIGQLAGGVAHDFNNLLTAISGHCDLLLLNHSPSDPDYGDLVQINQNANRAASLVGQLLAFSRKQTMKLQLIDLRETLSDMTHLLGRLVGSRMKLTLEHAGEVGLIRADPRQLEQVVMNLVVNARDAMPDGGEIRIETEERVLTEDLHRDRAVVPAGTYALVRVTDKGHGIPTDKLTKIFEPFFTTKRTGEGTGLGLSTVYGIVKQTGGFIFVDSLPGSGTTFTLYFPIHSDEAVTGAEDADPAQAPDPAPAARPRSGEGVVLLVEDEAPVRAFASRALRLRGYTVLEAENAEEALKALEDPSLAIDVFVTDVVMPGMDGPSWVTKALEQRPETRVVFVSGYAEETFSDAQSRIPNSVFLPKPFSLSDLTTTVQRQLH